MYKSIFAYVLTIVVLMSCLACWLGAGEADGITAADTLAHYAIWLLLC